ncbi:2-polyprenyl-6-methoxyphenol hydroxylase [Nocardia amikacinitolerans]|uniref:2-polyprenyl-6-methoxyphenol hydroxylase n=1 Tax=Nocardia amikacinitolerans TaxID=756689 RepID=A0A285KVE2_9NOCA|nr:FAD-dependent monooxygenase [Nocardia amikacinitolerans]MCP2275955.1 2-polyprenyl-6-methoxyphenol hydroxylase [Nocardia amikacinitolerans]SNY76632.1 2-polyprenyl-6-methoxyphenol hydroxylase [Nocardia amikacinitolerans]
MVDTEVLVVGAGPVGLTAAIELARRGVRCRIIDAAVEPPRYAKAVGVQPRTLEVFEGMGVLRQVLDSSILLRGQIVYVNGAEVERVALALPADIPYRFVGLPQYETERILRKRLATTGTRIERGTTLTHFEQDDSGVHMVLTDEKGERRVQAQYLIGCDGAHSVVRKGLGLAFEGAAFAEEYMLGDVELDWSMPRGYGIRSMHRTDGVTDDLLVCVPLPGQRRYRVSMLVPEELATAPRTGAAVEHGFEGAHAPELHHIQAVLDRLAPEPVTASSLRWSSVFRISHRIVDSYSRGRVFVAGDAAHIHPPTGAQGMNTGIQDAHNLAWKLALTLGGVGSADLLASYDAERRPVGEEVVGRTVRSAREGIGAGETDPDYVLRREAQLLIDYSGSPLTSHPPDDQPGPRPGHRAPDADGLTRDAVAYPIRLFSLLGRTDHTVLLYLDDTAGPESPTTVCALTDAARRATHGKVDLYLITTPTADPEASTLPVIRDRDGGFARAYGAKGLAAYVIRPDGYLGFAEHDPTPEDLTKHFAQIFR